MNVLLFLEDHRNYQKLKYLMVLPLLFAVLLLVDGFLPEKSAEHKEYYIYGNTGGGRYSDSGKYLKTLLRKITITNEVYYDLDHLQPVQFIHTPLFETFKLLVYKSREQPDTSYEYQPLFSVYSFHSLWVWLLVAVSCVALLAKHPEIISYASILSWALAILLLLAII
ncbi:hypothetical protein [Rufibacter tibetensis]|uniref:Uncharacterized protein n=1 Tax=Rufibacter tibetensis TaxID=512763 RepID=A0A0P0CF54_9BACT|nr:hypothetical protein [Rufibacter tibetensis]ALJ00495.1 hypothetical protein DC20_17875 [Rufibacter tibetensis]